MTTEDYIKLHTREHKKIPKLFKLIVLLFGLGVMFCIVQSLKMIGL